MAALHDIFKRQGNSKVRTEDTFMANLACAHARHLAANKNGQSTSFSSIPKVWVTTAEHMFIC